MNVQELAEDLEVDVTEVLARCATLGIAATPDGELDGGAVARIRIALASPPAAAAPPPSPPTPVVTDPVAVPPVVGEPTRAVAVATVDGPGDQDPTRAAVGVDAGVTQAMDTVVAPNEPSSASPPPPPPTVVAPAADLPPNVLASSPAALADAVASAPPTLDDAEHGPLRHAADPAPDGASRPGLVPTPTGRVSNAPPPAKPAPRAVHLDRAIRPAAVALAVAVVSVVLAFQLAGPAVWASVALLIVAGGCLLDAIIGASRARYRTSLHPERYRGRGLAALITVGATVTLVAYGLLGWVVFRSAPANEGHLGGIGRTELVQRLRWTQQRTRLVARSGWKRPVKENGTCWTEPDAATLKAAAAKAAKTAKPPLRREYGDTNVACTSPHRYEVIAVYALPPRPDAPYPGLARLQADAAVRCRALLAARRPPAGWTLVADVPVRDWGQADHDIACLAKAPADAVAPLPSA